MAAPPLTAYSSTIRNVMDSTHNASLSPCMCPMWRLEITNMLLSATAPPYRITFCFTVRSSLCKVFARLGVTVAHSIIKTELSPPTVSSRSFPPGATSTSAWTLANIAQVSARFCQTPPPPRTLGDDGEAHLLTTNAWTVDICHTRVLMHICNVAKTN